MIVLTADRNTGTGGGEGGGLKRLQCPSQRVHTVALADREGTGLLPNIQQFNMEDVVATTATATVAVVKVAVAAGIVAIDAGVPSSVVIRSLLPSDGAAGRCLRSAALVRTNGG